MICTANQPLFHVSYERGILRDSGKQLFRHITLTSVPYCMYIELTQPRSSACDPPNTQCSLKLTVKPAIESRLQAAVHQMIPHLHPTIYEFCRTTFSPPRFQCFALTQSRYLYHPSQKFLYEKHQAYLHLASRSSIIAQQLSSSSASIKIEKAHFDESHIYLCNL